MNMAAKIKVQKLPELAEMLERCQTILSAQCEELLHLRRAVLKTSELDDIHDLRVASRRFRAALGLFAPLTRVGSVSGLRRRVRKLTRALGGLRNIDEALLFFKSRTPAESAENNRICSILPEMRAGELRRIHRVLKNFDHKMLDRTVRKVTTGLSVQQITKRAKSSLTACFSEASVNIYRPIHDLLAIATAPDQSGSRHALRIAIKKWRYFLETVAPVQKRDYAAVLGLLKEYQTILGRMNDVAEFALLCRNLELSPAELENIEKILRDEEQSLLKSFTVLVECKPLSYTFLI